MAVLEQVQAVLGSGYTVAVAVVGLVTVLFKLLSRGLDFHDRHIVRKDFERLRVLREYASDGAPFANYLDGAIQVESFRIASGISTSPVKMDYLLKLAKMGRWDRGQLRALSAYIRLLPNSVEPEVHIGKLHSFDGFFSLFGGFYFIFAGLFFLVYAGVFVESPLGWFVGGAICLVFFICALGMWKGFSSYQIAKNAKKYLDLTKVKDAESASSESRALERAPSKCLEEISG